MSLTNTYKDAVLNWLLVPAQSVTRPTAPLYLVLLTASPGAAGSVANEVAASVGYTRQAVTNAASSGGAGSVLSSGAVSFGPASGAGFGTVSYFAYAQGGTRGVADLIAFGALAVARTVTAGQFLDFADGSITNTAS